MRPPPLWRVRQVQVAVDGGTTDSHQVGDAELREPRGRKGVNLLVLRALPRVLFWARPFRPPLPGDIRGISIARQRLGGRFRPPGRYLERLAVTEHAALQR